jgi:hypothetical protein
MTGACGMVRRIRGEKGRTAIPQRTECAAELHARIVNVQQMFLRVFELMVFLRNYK